MENAKQPEIVIKKITEISPYEKNPRRNDEAVKYVAASIEKFGFKQPIVIDRDGIIVAGHTRYKAAKKLNLKAVPCIVADDLTDEQIKAYRLADNKVAEKADWDFDLLAGELNDLFDFDMTEFGFDELVEEDDEPTETVEDDFDSELPAEPKAKLGDIWQLGRHRLMCGSSTNEKDVQKLMNGEKAKMLFTSPPYSDMREYNGGKDLSVEHISSFIAKYKPFTDYQCVNLGIQRKDHEIVQYWDKYIDVARQCGYKLMAWNIWDKTKCGSIGNQSAFFPIRHEWIFVFGTEFYEINCTVEKAKESIKIGKHTRKVRQADGTMSESSTGDLSNKYKQMESVVQILPEQGSIIKEHPATFPVQLPAEYIQAMTDENDIVIESFGGSGSTLIACEQLNRTCYMMELDPKYVDVIIARWEQFTGEKAVLIKGDKK